MTDWQLGFQAFHEGRMREAADRLSVATADAELTVTRDVRYESSAYLGAALYALGMGVESVSAFEAAFQLSPTPTVSPDLSLNLTHAYLAAGRREAARETLLYLLEHSPGHVAARMLLQRLDSTPQDEAVTGSILGASVESVKKYISTLAFETSESGGYEPAQVREALHQLESYIDGLDKHLREGKETITRYEEEIQRLRQMEDAMVQNIVQMQNPVPLDETTAAELSPIEILFQKKH